MTARILPKRPFLELSGGQKQLVCLLSVLVMQPGLLILDEPMTSLDALSTGRIRKMLTSLPQSIVMVSHDLDAFAGFERVIWLEDGRVRMDGLPDDVCAAYREDVDARLERDPRGRLVISVYLPGKSWAHRLPAGWKMALLAIASLVFFQLTDLRIFVVSLLVVMAFYGAIGMEGMRRLLRLRPLLWLVLALVAIHWLLGTLHEGLIVAFRISILVLGANFVSITTRLDDMMSTVMPLFIPLKFIGIPPRAPALAVMLVLRFAPVSCRPLRSIARGIPGTVGSRRQLAAAGTFHPASPQGFRERR